MGFGEMILPNSITSKTNENIKHTIKLFNSSKARRENSEFPIEGLRLCSDAVKSSFKINKTFYTKEFYYNFKNQTEEILSLSDESYIVDEKIMNYMADTQTPQGIICICEFNDTILKLDRSISRVLVLDNIQNPSNLGAMMRICDALNFDGMVISKDSCDIYNPKAIRGSMGSIFRTKVLISENLEATIIYLNEIGMATLGMVVERDSMDIKKFGNLERVALVIGNEGNGIRDNVIKACKYKAFIPINKRVNSLNASVAAAIAMWEISR